MEGPFVTEKFFNWVFGSISAAISFFAGMFINTQIRVNKLEQNLALNDQNDKERAQDINEIKLNYHQIDAKLTTMLNVVYDQKIIFNSNEIQRQELADLVKKQSELINELIN